MSHFQKRNYHGYLRPILLKHWADCDLDMKIYGPMPRDATSKMNYIVQMKNSKYCLCPKGYEEIPNLKDILLILGEKYLEMQFSVRKIQQHFLWHAKPVKYDLFYVTLHSIWHNSVFEIKSKRMIGGFIKEKQAADGKRKRQG
ncbi:hypothetical protein Nepgr_015538 [Nepenthes gracilis]|uniref:Uncharacterized protein n=1 Tax=Nepenthes gracilis TaxID=150966 RepID=A0AAD3SNF5_NEPGR|nr:hypothetical protein Nepgr_015538 [Nepenthes gracilis]